MFLTSRPIACLLFLGRLNIEGGQKSMELDNSVPLTFQHVMKCIIEDQRSFDTVL